MANEVKDMTAVTSDTETQIWGTSPQIIVTGTAERPFYRIMYRENKDGEIHLGFGSYDLSYVFNWLKEFFGVTRASAVDPESLKPKGRWELMGETDYKCSVCGFRFTSGDPIEMFPYCRCGAKMEG